jgi:hypothetical protein
MPQPTTLPRAPYVEVIFPEYLEVSLNQGTVTTECSCNLKYHEETCSVYGRLMIQIDSEDTEEKENHEELPQTRTGKSQVMAKDIKTSNGS